MSRLKGKVAFITGGGGGIGRATAERFAEEGAQVVVAEIEPSVGEKAAEAARKKGINAGGDAFFIKTNVSDTDSVQAAIKKTIDRFGKLDILHNNAGGSTLQDGPVTEAPVEEFWRCINLDLFGTFLCSKYAIPEIIKSGGGSIINMSSNVALMALPGRDCYTAAKGAIASMTRSMAVEYAPNKIRVNAIAPSVILSDRVKKLLAASPEIEAISKTHLLGLGEPIHVADLAVYLAADESAITTGQVISVDSGVTIV
jgi:NAD(P)-dependent dehydrogenase (short-subunit alcohol dehydrogenase family)